MLIRPVPQSKPRPGALVDWAHPLARGLAGAWLFNEGAGQSIYNAAGPGNAGTCYNGPTWVPSVRGGGLNFAASSSQYVDCGVVAAINGASQATIFVAGYVAGTTGSFLAGRYTTTTYRFAIGVSGGTAYFITEADYSTTYPNCPFAGGDFTMAMVYDDTLSGWASIAGYIDGVPVTLTPGGTAPSGPLSSRTDTWRVGWDQADGSFMTGRADLVYVWGGRALGAGEISSLHANPWQFLAVPWFYGPPRASTYAPWIFGDQIQEAMG